MFSIKKIFLLSFILFFAATSGFSKFENKVALPDLRCIYDVLQLAELGLDEAIFDRALLGFAALQNQQCLQNTSLLSIVDLSQSSNSKRLYVIDMENKKVLFNTYVAHGRNSGEEFAHSFANVAESFKSSIGFYVTGNSYDGACGLSMKLQGMEQGINDAAEPRGIVMHGAKYVSESFIKQNGRLGRSQGCPAVAEELCKPIVNCIKEGSCFFMFYPDSNYLKASVMM